MFSRSFRIPRVISQRKLFLNSVIVGSIVLLILIFKTHFDDDDELVALKLCKKSRLMGMRTLSEFLHSDRDTAIVVPKSINAIYERKFIAVYVPSLPEKSRIRQVIRDTWGTVLNPIFVIGVPSDPKEKLEIEIEAERYDDIIVEDFIDTYDNLTLKTGFAMKHFIRHFSNSSFFFKLDDDVLLNVENLYDSLKKAPENSLIGGISSKIRPLKNSRSKWFVPDCVFADKFYPDYMQGPGYVIPGEKKFRKRSKRVKIKSIISIHVFLGHLVDTIFNEGLKMKYFPIEDIFWTGLVAGQKLNMRLYDDAAFEYQIFSPTDLILGYPCLLSEYSAMHKVSEESMIITWRKLKANDECSNVAKLISKSLKLMRSLNRLKLS